MEEVFPRLGEVFEIEDFTAASPWEKLVAQMEDCLRSAASTDSKLDHDLASTAGVVWEHTLSFNGKDLILQRHDYRRPPRSVELDPAFASLPADIQHLLRNSVDDSSSIGHQYHHCLNQWFGVDEFLVVTSAPEGFKEHDAALILSALNCSSFFAECSIPLFVPVSDTYSATVYIGRITKAHHVIRLKTQKAKRPPLLLKNLDGIESLYRNQVSTENRTLLHYWISAVWKYSMSSSEFLKASSREYWRDFAVDDSVSRGFGWGPNVFRDPVDQIELEVSWPHFLPGDFQENSSFTDFNPYEAPRMLLTVAYSPLSRSDLLFSETFARFMAICNFGAKFPSMHLLSRLSDSDNATILSLIQSISPSFTKDEIELFVLGSPPSAEVLESEMDVVFSDLEIDFHEGSDLVETKLGYCSSRGNSLLSKLILRLFVIVLADPSKLHLRTIMVFWEYFVCRLQGYWEKRELLPSTVIGHPNLNQCLLNQKVELVNFCISRINSKSTTTELESSPKTSSLPDPLDSFDFFGEDIADATWVRESKKSPSEADNDASGWFDLQELSSPGKDSKDESTGDGFISPRGVNSSVVLEGMLLLRGVPMNAPFTQEHPPVTSDVLEQKLELLQKLGSSREASLLRAEIQGHTLLCDMQAFKAANPGCVFEDFIRWYSPNDWQVDLDEESLKKFPSRACVLSGKLSERMNSPSNLWQNLWKQADPIPAHLQVPLFDHLKEGEVALDYIRTVEPSSFFHQLCLIALTVFLRCFREVLSGHLHHVSSSELDSGLSTITEVVGGIIVDARSQIELGTLYAFKDHFQEKCANLENLVARACALISRFPKDLLLVNYLLKHGSIVLDDEYSRETVSHLMIGLPNKENSGPTYREYRISGTSSVADKSSGGSGSASEGTFQRLFVSISDRPREFIFATAWGNCES